jgi:hypothetical protein
MMRVGSVLTAAIIVVALFAGCIGDTSQPSITRIPKIIMDYVDNQTVVTVMALGEHRYDHIYVNHTTHEGSFNNSSSHRYAMVVPIQDTSYALNVTVLDKRDLYMLNCTVRVDLADPAKPLFWVREERQTKESDHASPYTVVLEWRETVEG